MSARERPSPVYQRARLLPALLALAATAAGFVTLLVRLAVTREGYRLSAAGAGIARLEEENRALRLSTAELGSHARLRALAPKYGLGPPRPEQVVVVP